LQGGELDVDWNFPPSQIAALQGSKTAKVCHGCLDQDYLLLFQTRPSPSTT